MLYSVLMSVYKNDTPEFLGAALESIYDQQTRKPDEIVVVFDGPLNGDLYSVLDSFRLGKEEIVKYLPQDENRGLGEALRIGSEQCSGDYIFRMDSDDISAKNRFEEQASYMESHPEIDVLGTDIAEFNVDPFQEKTRLRVCPAEHSDIVKMAKRRNPMNHVSVCIKKDALLNAGGYQTLFLLEDYLLWLNMIGCGCKLANLNMPLVYVRVGNGFENKRGSKNRVIGWSKLQEVMLKNGMINKYEALMNKIYIRMFVYTPPCVKKILYESILRK